MGGMVDDAPAFLGVEQSLTGRRWQAPAGDDRTALALAQRLALPEVIARVLAARGVTPDSAETFLEPRLRVGLPDPSSLVDMEVGAARLADAVMAGEPIAVFADYDVDGATSAALLSRFLVATGAPAPRIYVPDRQAEGYGPNAAALRRLRAEGSALAITVDCGTTAHEALEAARDAGLQMIVVDHHVAEPRLPPAVAVINPNRLDDASSHGELAAVGVAFLLAVAVNRCLRQRGWYESRAEPDLRQLLDLVALGSICDMAPLVGVNRVLVAQGLKVMARRANLGLRTLADVAGIDSAPGTYHAGFLLGPRINAGGRVGEADLGARLLTTDDAAEASALAVRLDAYNRERQAIEAAVLDGALTEAEAQVGEGDVPPVLVVSGTGWHPGVVGIVASRLVERFRRPTCVLSVDRDSGQASGSGRSIAGVDLGSAVIAACQAGLLVKGGGHPMAAGFTLEESRIDAFSEFLADRLGAAIGAAAARPGLRLDGVLTPAGATLGLAETLDRVGPFGIGNPEPRFALTGVRVAYAAAVGDAHLRCVLEGGGGRVDGIAFRCRETPLGDALAAGDGAPLLVAGRLRADTWRGRTRVQFHIDDAASSFGAG